MRLQTLKKIVITLLILVISAVGSEKKNSSELEILADSLLSNLPDSLKNARITVVPFTESAAQGKGYGESLAEFMIVAIQNRGIFTLVDRSEFQRVVDEISLSQTGMIGDSATLEIGKMLSSQYILSGSISMLFGKYRITAKIINTETTQIIKSSAITVKFADLENISKELLGESGKVSASIFRSLLIPGWGQFYTNHNTRGVLNLTACFGAIGATSYYAYNVAQARNKKDKHVAEQFSSAADSFTNEQILEHDRETKKLYSKYSKQVDRLNLCFITLGSLWAVNLIDASIAGAQARKKIQLYFSGDYSDKSFQSGIVLRF